MIVLDVNAAVAIMRGTPEGEALKALMLDQEEAIAPKLFASEFGNTLWQYVQAGFIGKNEARDLLAVGMGLVDGFFDDEGLLGEALAEAARLNHPVYDMLYVVLARRCTATLFTLDKRLQNLCVDIGVNCVCLDAAF